MPLVLSCLFGIVGFTLFSLIDPPYGNLARTMIAIYGVIIVIAGVLDLIVNRPRRVG